jgi:SAM-dependent methyltransferase
VIENYQAWDLREVVGYYESLRNKPEDLYESERVLLFPLLREAKSVLDIGCAAGGMYNIIRQINPRIQYTGVDVSENMVKMAKQLFPEGDFQLTHGGPFNFSEGSFDLVMALGVLNHIPEYCRVMKDAWRVTRQYCLLDLPRLLPAEYRFDIEKSFMLLKNRFHGKTEVLQEATKVPYVLADAGDIFDFMVRELRPVCLLAKGYFGKCDPSVTIPASEVCFTVVCLEKKGGGGTSVVVDLPKSIRERVMNRGIEIAEPFEWILK